MKSIAELFDLTGRTAVVTGASYGLGAAFAEALFGQGANVVLAARSKAKLEEVAQSLGSPERVLSVTCDVAEAAQVEELMSNTVERFGRIDILVNNAGVVPDAGMRPERVADELFAHTVKVNLLGVWYCCHHASRYMLSDGKGGSIVNLSSIAGLNGVGDFPISYQATKAAVVNLTRNLACSWADRGVRVNALAPGWFPSEMTAGAFSIPPFLEWAKKMAPMGRIGRIEELIPALLFLASDAGSFVTGQTWAIDGGISASGSTPWPEEAFEILAAAGMGDLARKITPSAKAGA